MKIILSIILLMFCLLVQAQNIVKEVVFVESPTDTDFDGKKDKIYVEIQRPMFKSNLATLYFISPYSLGGTEGGMHDVDVDYLPQDTNQTIISSNIENSIQFGSLKSKSISYTVPSSSVGIFNELDSTKYAKIKAHSLGTGYSSGCPTLGAMSETLAAKSVIDWLNGSAKAYNKKGEQVKASWANGNVGMTGVSYNGTLPIMVAATGVKGLKAIVPVAAISNWYNYYRANGLVVNPGGYIGEDIDSLGVYIARKGTCKKEIRAITQTMGREHGDYTPFWQERNYLPLVKNYTAATFIIHGQNDWNVKQKHAIDLWNALEGIVPRRLYLHRGKHERVNLRAIQDWFDYFVLGEENDVTSGEQVSVQMRDWSVMKQKEWPAENTTTELFYFSKNRELQSKPANKYEFTIEDIGRVKKASDLIKEPEKESSERVIFLSKRFEHDKLISGTPEVEIQLSVENRSAANLSVAIIEYKNGKGQIITRGWADPQNFQELETSTPLTLGQRYNLKFELEPKQYKVSKGSQIGVIIYSTDFNYTLRPSAGTKLTIYTGEFSIIRLNIGNL